MIKELIPGLFSFHGRMGRAEFWMLSIALSVVTGGALMVVAMLVLIIVGGERAQALAPLYVAAKSLIQLLSLWPSLAILAKRGHDRNRPAALSIGLWVAAVVAFMVGGVFPPFAGLGALICVYFLVDYGFIPGTPGPNRYDSNRPGKRSESAARAAALFD